LKSLIGAIVEHIFLLNIRLYLIELQIGM